MPALWSPEDLAARYAPYIEELHDVFAMHALHYGSPEDIRPLADRLAAPGSLNEELAALVRSMVLREGGSLPRTDLLEILAIAISGPRMDPAGEELQQAVRQLLTFLHGALRRPWNEPAGEERLHPEREDTRAQAARELRAAAAKIEAEAQAPKEETEADEHPRAVVIPFGRARAVFSRLARTEEADLPDEAAPVALVGDAPVAAIEEPALEMARSAAEEPTPQSAAIRIVPEAQREAAQDAVVPIEESMPVEEIVQTGEEAGDPAAVLSAAAVASSALTDQTVLQPKAAERPGKLRDLKLPAVQRPVLIAFASGAIAAALVAAVLELAAHGVSHLRNVSASATLPAGAQGANSSAGKTKSSPVVPQLASLPPADPVPPAPGARHVYDDYIAPPYSSMPQQSAASESVSATASLPTRVSNPHTVVSTHASSTASPALVEVASVETRTRDPDAMIAGGEPSRGVAFERPLHPNISAAMMAENLLSAPRPDFPVLAKIAHVEGPVVLHAEIAPNGSVADTDVISGHYLLRHAAEQAVRHWRYRPYQVDGRPVAVSTTITVRFRHPR